MLGFPIHYSWELRVFGFYCNKTIQTTNHTSSLNPKPQIHNTTNKDIKDTLLQQPGPKKFKLSKIELKYKAKKFKVLPFTPETRNRIHNRTNED